MEEKRDAAGSGNGSTGCGSNGGVGEGMGGMMDVMGRTTDSVDGSGDGLLVLLVDEVGESTGTVAVVKRSSMVDEARVSSAVDEAGRNVVGIISPMAEEV